MSKAKYKKKGESRKKQIITQKGSSVTLLADFSSDNMEARNQWDDIVTVVKEKQLVNQNCFNTEVRDQLPA